MKRRDFLTHSLATGAAATALANSTPAAEPQPAAAAALPVLAGPAVISGPAPQSLVVLQPVHGPATGFIELSLGDEPFRRIEADTAGLQPYGEHVLKFSLPALPAGIAVRYRVVATPIDFKNAYKIVRGESVTSPTQSFRTLDPSAAETRFTIWNDTHENQ